MTTKLKQAIEHVEKLIAKEPSYWAAFSDITYEIQKLEAQRKELVAWVSLVDTVDDKDEFGQGYESAMLDVLRKLNGPERVKDDQQHR